MSKYILYIAGPILWALLYSASAFAQSGPGKFNVSGGLFHANGTAITNAHVNFKVEVYDTAASCLLYSEEHLAQDLSVTKGGFSLEIGLGTSQSNPLEGTTAFSSKIFHNPGVVGAFSGCASGVTLASGSDRLIRVSYDLGSGFVAMTPDVPITSAPYAMVAETLQGKTPSDFILTNVNTQLSQNSMEYLFTNTNYANLKALVDGTSTQYMVSNPASDVSFNSRKLVNVADPTSAQDAATKNYSDTFMGGQPVDMTGIAPGVGGNSVLAWDQVQNKWVARTFGSVSSITAGTGLNGGTIVSAGTLSVDVGTTANKILQLNGSAQIPAVNGSLLTNVNAVQLWSRDVSSVAPTAGQVLTWNVSGAMWEASTPSGGTITALVGDVTASGSGAVTATIANNAINSAKINSTGISKNLLLITDSTTGAGVGYMSCSLGQVLQWDANGWGCVDMSVALGTSGVTAGTYGSDTMVPRVTVDAQGRVTALSNVNIAFPVTSVAGRTGAVTLIASDIGGLGTAALVNVGTGSSNVPQLDAFGRMPAVDGSQLTNLTAGSVSGVATGTGLVGGTITTYGTLSVDVGTTPNKILQLTAGAQIPAVDGNLVTNVNAVKIQTRNVSASAPNPGQVLGWNGSSSQWEPASVTSGTVTQVASGTGLLGGPISSTGTLSVDVGTGSNQIVQLDSSAKLPGVDGSALSNLNATRIGTRTVATIAPGIGQILSWNNSTSQWEPMAPATSGTVTNVATGNGLLGGPITNNGTLSVDTGTTGNKILQLTAGAQIPAVDGNLVTNVNAVKLQARDVASTAPTSGQVLSWNNLTSVWEPRSVTSGTVTTVSSGTGLLGGPISSNGTLSVDVGTGANQIVQLDSSAKLPAVDGSALSNLNATRIGTRTIATTAPSTGQYIGWNNSTSQWEPMAPATSGTVTNVATGNGLLGGPITNNGTLSVDTGITGNKILQLTAGAQIPAVDGNLVTNVNAVKLQARNVSSAAPGGGQVLGWNALNSVWEPTFVTNGTVIQISSGSGLLGGPISSTGTLSVDVGTGANQIVQLDSSAKLPGVDGSALSNLNATRIGTRTVATIAPGIGQILSWNNSTSQWEPMAPATSGTVTNVATGNGLLGGPITNNGTLSVDTGVTGNKILQLTAGAQIPAVDGNLVTNVNAVKLQARDVASTAPTSGQVLAWNNLSSVWEPRSVTSGTVTNVATGTGLLGGPISSNGTLSVDVGIGANQILQLDSSAKLPAVDGSALSNLNATRIGTRTVATTAPGAGQVLSWNNLNSQWEPMAPATSGTVTNVATGNGLLGGPITNNGTLSVDTGVTGNKILQLTAGAQIPAVDGNLVTNVNAVKLQARDVAATAPVSGQVLGWNGLGGVWEPMSTAVGSVTNVAAGTGLLGGPISSSGTLSVDVGTTGNKILQLTAGAQIPAVDGNLVTNVNAVKLQTRDVAATAPTSGQVLSWNNLSSVWEPRSVTSGTVTNVATGTGLLGGPISSNGTLSVDVGTGANQIVQLDSSAKMPAVDGSALSNLNATRIGTRAIATTAPSAGQYVGWNNSTSQWEPMAPATTGTVTNVASGTGLVGGPISSTGTLSVDVGTTSNKILQLTAAAQIPAVDGNLVTNINAVKLQTRNVASTAPISGQVLGWNGLSSNWEPMSTAVGSVTSVATGTGLLGGSITSSGTLSVDVGTSANQIVQLDSSAKLPAIDGSALSNLNATRIGTRTIATTAPGVGQYIGWNNSTSQWEPMAPATSGTVTNVATGTGLVGGPISNAGTLSVDVGTTSNKILQLTTTAQIPAVDGNLVTNINAVKLQTRDVAATAPGIGQYLGWNNSTSQWEPMAPATSGTVTNVAAGAGLLGGPISNTGTLSVDVGTTSNKIIQLTASAQIPAVDGNLVTNVNAVKLQTRDVASTAPTAGQVLSWNALSSTWEPSSVTSGTVTTVNSGTGLVGGPITNNGTLSVDVGTTSFKIVQLNANAQLPAVDGSLLTNINGWKLGGNTVGTDQSIGTIDNFGFVIKTSNTNRITVANDGKVGIGSSSPTEALDVSGNIALSGYIVQPSGINGDNFIGGILNIQGYANGNIAYLDAGNHLTQTDVALQIRTLNGTSEINAVRVTKEGYVGIGTPTPRAVLEISSNSDPTKSAIIVPQDTSGNRPTGVNGMIRYNTSTSKFEAFENNAWVSMTASGAGVGSNGNSNAIQVSDGSGGFISNNSIAIDVVNGRIGVGTASPGSYLHVQKSLAAGNVAINSENTDATGTAQLRATAGLANFQISQFGENSTQGSLLTGGPDAAGIMRIRQGGVPQNKGILMVTSATAPIYFATDDRLRMTIDAAGRVGIGTSVPEALLDLTTTVSGQSAIIVPRDTQANRPSTGVNGMIRYNTSTNTLESFANGSWQSLAGAGTGSYLPLIGGTLTGPILQANGTAAAPSYSFSASTGTGVYSPTAGNLSLATNGVQRLNIDSSGNVGIGTSSPASKLDVLSYNINVGADWSTGTARTDATGKGGYVTFPHYTNSQPPIAMIGSLNSSSGNTVSFGGGTTNYNAATNLVFYTAANSTTVAGTERMRIDSNGNVGIGTNTPNAAFHVNIAQNSSTSARVENSDPGTSALASMNIVSEAAGIQIASYSTTVSSAFGGQPVADSVVIRTFNSPAPSRMMIGTQTAIPMYLVTGNTTRMAFDSSGNVGIGTSMPQALLDLATTTSGQSALIVPRDTTANRPSSGVNGMVRYNTDTAAFEGFANGSWGSLAGSGVGQWNNGAANSINYTAGNVGIGTASPSDILHVYQNANAAVRVFVNNPSTGTGAFSEFKGTTNAGDMKIGLGSSSNIATLGNAGKSYWIGPSDFQLAPGGTEKVRITASGNVGIGTSSPTAKLEVAGSVSTSDWGTAGIGFKIPTATYQNTTSSGTINSSVHVIASPTLSATNPTTVNVSTLAISAPTMSTNVTGGSVSALSLVGNLVQSVGSASFSAGTTPSFAGLVNLNGNRSASSWNTNGAMLAVHANTLTNSSGSGTLATQVSNSFGAPTMASTNALTVTNAANVYIAGAPVAGTNTTITNAQALHVASGTSYFGGNVGVGTVTPQSILDVATTTSGQSAIIVPRDTTANRPPSGVNGMIRYNTSTSVLEGYVNGTWTSLGGSGSSYLPLSGGTMTGAILQANGTAAAPSYSFSASSGSGLYSPGTNNLSLATSGSQRLTIDQLGNIGIGTGSPESQLHLLANGTANRLILERIQDTGASAGLIGRKARGSVGSMSGINSGESLLSILGVGYNSSNTYSGNVASIIFESSEAFTATGNGTNIQFGTTPIGSTVRAERMRIADSGNIGIGTTTPQALLHVAGPIRVDPATLPSSPAAGAIAVDSGAANALKYYDGSGWHTIGPSADLFTTSSVSSSRSYMNAGNFILLNSGSDLSWSPSGAMLPATGVLMGGTSGIVFTGTTSTLVGKRYIKSSGGDFILNRCTADPCDSGPTATIDIDSSDNIKFGGRFGSGVSSLTTTAVMSLGKSTASWPATSGSSQGSGHIIRLTKTGAGGGSFDIGSNGQEGFWLQAGNSGSLDVTYPLLFNPNGGNVGIGTTTPQALLDLSTTTSGRSALIVPRDTTANRPATGVNGMIRYNTSTNVLESYVNGGWTSLAGAGGSYLPLSGGTMTGPILQANGSAAAPSYSFSGSTGTGVYSSATDSLSLATGGTQRINIDQLGNVAIGTSSALYVSANGRIGIGTDSPSRLLDVSSSSTATSIGIVNSSAGGKTFTLGSTGAGNALGAGNFYLYDADNSAFRMVVSPTGNVGIGTLTPSAKLDVKEGAISVRSSSTNAGLYLYNSNVGDDATLRGYKSGGSSVDSPSAVPINTRLLRIQGIGHDGTSYSGNGNAEIRFQAAEAFTPTAKGTYLTFLTTPLGSTTAAERLRITSSGAIGIGTNNPQALLDLDTTTSGQSALIVPRDTQANRPATGVNGMIRYNTSTAKFEAFENSTWSNLISSGASSSGTTGAIQYSNGSGGFVSNNNIFIDGTNGRVGIGTAAPGYKLQVNGPASNTVPLTRITDGSVFFDQYIGTGASAGANWGTTSNDSMLIFTNNFNRMSINKGGGVAIGDTTFIGTAPPTDGLTVKGNVGIGTSSPGTGTKLSVAGQIHSKSASTTSNSIDWSNGNAITTTHDCSTPISFVNLRDGGSYTLIVTSTATTKCDFSTTSTGDDAAAGTLSYRYSPANAVRTGSSHTVYSLLRVGNIVYVSWITGF